MMRSGALVQGFCEILEFHVGQKVWDSFDFAVIVFFLLDLSGRMEEVVKFSTTVLSAKILMQSFPPSRGDLGVFLLGYRIDRMFSRYRGYSTKCLRVALDLLNLKRCCPTVSDDFVRGAMQKHAQTICGPFRSADTPLEVHEELKLFMRNQVADFGFPDPLKLELPSLSGCFGITRSSGGAEGLVDRWEVPKEEVKTVYNQRLYKKEVRLRQANKEIFRSYGLDPDCSELILEPLGLGLSYPRGLLHCVRHEILNPLEDFISAEAIPIAEPCKVRVITKGDPVPYLAAKSFQTSVSKWLSKNRNLSLTRSSFSEADVVTFLEDSVAYYGIRDLLIISADYSAATDNLLSDLSVKVASEFVPIFGSTYVDLLIRALTRHVVYYDRSLLGSVPDGFLYEKQNGRDVTEDDWINRLDRKSALYGVKKVRVYGVQHNGQLMGSYASFVTLCLANLAVIGSVVRPLGKVRRLPILVNGDDSLFCLPSLADYEVWKDRTTQCGLALSPGKNYVVPWNPSSNKPSFLMINSKGFQINGMSVRHVPYINGGLLRGWTKLNAEFWSLHSAENGIASRFNQLTSGFDPKVSWLLAKKFIRWWSWALYNPGIIPSSVPWYLPESFGGLGFNPIIVLGHRCCPGRENRPLDLTCAYGIFTEFRGPPVKAEGYSVPEEKDYLVGERKMVRAVQPVRHALSYNADSIILWRSLTRRYKSESSSLCRRAAKLQDKVDAVCAKGGVRFVFSRTPLLRTDYPLGWVDPEAVPPLFCGRISDKADFPMRELAQFEMDEDHRPSFGKESYEWRHREFLRGVKEWDRTLKRFYHFQRPEHMTNCALEDFLWSHQFVTPLVRLGWTDGISCDNPELKLFPDDLLFQGVKLIAREDVAPYREISVRG